MVIKMVLRYERARRFQYVFSPGRKNRPHCNAMQLVPAFEIQGGWCTWLGLKRGSCFVREQGILGFCGVRVKQGSLSIPTVCIGA